MSRITSQPDLKIAEDATGVLWGRETHGGSLTLIGAQRGTQRLWAITIPAEQRTDVRARLLALLAPEPEPSATTMPGVPNDKPIQPCDHCGGDGNWHQWIAPTPETWAVRIYHGIRCPWCQGGGWVNTEPEPSDAEIEAAENAIGIYMGEYPSQESFDYCRNMIAKAVLTAARAARQTGGEN